MSRTRSARPTTLVVGIVLAATVAATAAVDHADAAEPAQDGVVEAQREVSRLEDRIADASSEVQQLDQRISSAQADLAAITQEISRLGEELVVADEALRTADARASEAREAEERAEEVLRRRRAELLAVGAELEDSRRRLASGVRETFMRGGTTTSPTLAVLAQLSTNGEARDLTDALQYAELVLEDRAVTVEDTERLTIRTSELTTEAHEAEQRLSARTALAAAAREEAAARSAALLELLGQVDEARLEQERLIGQLRSDREAADAEVDQLETEADAARAREQEARERVAREKAAREAAAREAAEREAAEREAADRAARGGSTGGGSTGGVSSTPVSPDLVRVGGITVAASLAPALADLLDAARADGIVLGGYGYRSPESTEQLRRINGCPDIHTSPASSCRVPTARPGESMHEQGLAIDFTYQGQTLCYPRSASQCTGNAGFDWLRANASRYGLKGLPSEAWHWSTNGR